METNETREEINGVAAIKKAFEALPSQAPLVHNITNYVTVNDCANALLAIKASPIMSDEPDDVVDITSICNALTINIGTLNEQSIKGMFLAGERAGELGHPIVLDPVGAGASKLRTDTASDLLDRLNITVIRANMSEARALAGAAATTRGVDVCPDDVVTRENLHESARFACELAARTNAVVVITGPIDLVANAHQAYAISNGSPLQSRITGAGCMLSCICAAYAAANEETLIEGMLAATVHMGLAGEQAAARMGANDGNGAFRSYLLDALYTMNADTLCAGAKIEAFEAAKSA
ncbi:MAG: hydroxyethylthiazole kinase [Eggerthellaceae bacterium]|jgi:hydroxyethylthiazole kinase|nr:hydroxyethylthiazole kinase [Eggerthellaceae bacterium]MDR2721998.1 hydroxyethylthiazole kinase [Coriobacteriaceae bacterium]